MFKYLNTLSWTQFCFCKWIISVFQFSGEKTILNTEFCLFKLLYLPGCFLQLCLPVTKKKKLYKQDKYNYYIASTISAATATAAKSLQSCPTLCDPVDGSPPGSPSLGFSRQEHWSGLPFPFPMRESEVAQLCLTLRDPMDCSPPGSSIHGILQARVLEWGAIAFSVR